jgi:hypothetical protein
MDIDEHDDTVDENDVFEVGISKVGMYYYPNITAFENDTTPKSTGDIAVAGAHPQPKYYIWHLINGHLRPRVLRRIVVNALNVRDSIDVVDHYEKVLTSMYIQKNVYVRLRPSNASITRLFTPDDTHLIYRRFHSFTLSYCLGRLVTVYARFWQTQRGSSDNHRLAERSVRIVGGLPPLRDVLIDLQTKFREASVGQASLSISVVMNRPQKRFNDHSISFLVGRKVPVPAGWHVGKHNRVEVVGAHKYLFNLFGPAATRNELRRLLQDCASKDKQYGHVESISLLSTQPPPELQIDLQLLVLSSIDSGISALESAGISNGRVPIARRQAEMRLMPIPGSEFRWSTNKRAYVPVVMVMLSLLPPGNYLPVYVVLEILDLMDEPYNWRSTQIERVQTIQGVFNSLRKLRVESAKRARIATLQ